MARNPCFPNSSPNSSSSFGKSPAPSPAPSPGRPTRRPSRPGNRPMRRVALIGVMVGLPFLAVPLHAQNGVDAVLARAQAAYERVKTTKATFDQTITNEMTGTTAVSHGELIQEE